MADENSTNRVIIEVVLDDGSVAKGFANIKNQGEDTAKGLSKVFNISGLADLQAAINLARGALNQFKNMVAEGINESIAGEQANLKLAQAMKSIPGVTNEAVKSFQDFSSELSKQIGIDDDVINANAAVLASLGRLSGEGLREATKAAADLSAGLGIGLEDASNRLAKAAEGNVTAFGRLGFQFTKGASDGQILQETLAQINQRFGGIAESIAGNTFQGVLNRLKVAFDDSNQALGDFITKSPVVREVLKFLAESFEKSTNFLKTINGTQFLNNIIIGFFNFSQAVVNYLIKPLEVFGNISKDVFSLVVIGFNTIIAAVGQVGGAIGFLLEKLGVGAEISSALSSFKESSADALVSSTENFNAFKGVFETPISNVLGDSLGALTARLDSVKDASTNALESVKVGTQETVTKLSDAAIKINGIYQDGILKTISASAQALGQSLVKGSAAFGDFKNVVLGIIGDIAIQIGTTLVGIGIGIENLKLALGTLSGGVAIAAGLALIAVGGALKALSGGGISVSTPTAVGGATAPGADLGGTTPINGEIGNTTETRQPKTDISVVFNGDILGDENSGRKLIELMNSAFDATGVTLRDGVVA